ncbi:hypothetical protein Q5H92_13770 [Hymenobacter sp. M29]|uniref:Uncharacterized protein n=1 Tax=Hymenobacter mellowenesis TaxID=3063995 RepID=A0ABT9AC62_9BACT|nr:hypothetical protein [Hymenobacter sp. M29]MDO7847433.1 hypothetical protein [Hymenobacter sp. M29]
MKKTTDYNQRARSMATFEADKDYEGFMPNPWDYQQLTTQLEHHGDGQYTEHHPVLYDTYFVPCGMMMHVNTITDRVVMRVWCQSQDQYLELAFSGNQYLDYLQPDDSGWDDLLNLVLEIGTPSMSRDED